MPKDMFSTVCERWQAARLPYSRPLQTDIGRNRADVDHQVGWMPGMLFSPRRGTYIGHIQRFDLLGGDKLRLHSNGTEGLRFVRSLPGSLFDHTPAPELQIARLA